MISVDSSYRLSELLGIHAYGTPTPGAGSGEMKLHRSYHRFDPPLQPLRKSETPPGNYQYGVGNGREPYYPTNTPSNEGGSASNSHSNGGGYQHTTGHSYSFPPPPPPGQHEGVKDRYSSSTTPGSSYNANSQGHSYSYPPPAPPAHEYGHENGLRTPSHSPKMARHERADNSRDRDLDVSDQDDRVKTKQKSPTISNAHPHPPQLQPRLMCWTDQDTGTDGEEGGKPLHYLIQTHEL